MAYPEDSYLKIFCKLSLAKNLKKTNLNLAKNPKWGYTNEFGYKAICLTMEYMDGTNKELADYFGIDPDHIIAIERDEPKIEYEPVVYEPFQLNGTWYIESEEHTTPVYMKRSVAYEKYPDGCWMELEENEGKEEEELNDDDIVVDTFCNLLRCDENGNEIAEGMCLGDFCEFYDIDIKDTDSVG